MIIAGFFGFWEIIITLVVLVAFLLPVVFRKLRGRSLQMTEKLDQLERLERMYRDGTLSEREFKREKRRVMKK